MFSVKCQLLVSVCPPSSLCSLLMQIRQLTPRSSNGWLTWPRSAGRLKVQLRFAVSMHSCVLDGVRVSVCHPVLCWTFWPHFQPLTFCDNMACMLVWQTYADMHVLRVNVALTCVAPTLQCAGASLWTHIHYLQGEFSQVKQRKTHKGSIWKYLVRNPKLWLQKLLVWLPVSMSKIRY